MAVSLTPGATARRLGVAPPTLRSWDRRYGIGPSGRSPGGHRRYDAVDIAVLEHMCRLIAEGTAPAEAAGAARQLRGAPDGPAPDRETARRRPGGHTIAVRGSAPNCQGLARAAIRLDTVAVERILTESVAAEGVVRTWQELAMPVLYGMGSKWEDTRRYVEVEHLLSWSVSSVLRRVTASPSLADSRPHRGVLLACAPQEFHTLPLEALGAALSEAGVPWRMLGAAAPLEAQVSAMRRTAPAALVVWSQLPHTAAWGGLAALAAEAARCREVTRLFAAGPGWHGHDPSPGVTRLNSLPEAVTVLTGTG